MPSDVEINRKIEKNRIRNAERALRDERIGLLAITRAFVREVPNPDRLLARIDAMVRVALENETVKPAVRASLVAGQSLVARAIEQELGKPQGLFDPHIGHIRPDHVAKIVDEAEEQPQMGLAAAVENNRIKQQNAQHIQNEILRFLKEKGAMTDPELLHHYLMAGNAPITRHKFTPQRAELSRRGRLLQTSEWRSDSDGRGWPVWDLAERLLLAET